MEFAAWFWRLQTGARSGGKILLARQICPAERRRGMGEMCPGVAHHPTPAERSCQGGQELSTPPSPSSPSRAFSSTVLATMFSSSMLMLSGRSAADVAPGTSLAASMALLLFFSFFYPLKSKQRPSTSVHPPAEELETEDCVPASAASCPVAVRLLLSSSSSSVSSSPARVRPVLRQTTVTYTMFKSSIYLHRYDDFHLGFVLFLSKCDVWEANAT